MRIIVFILVLFPFLLPSQGFFQFRIDQNEIGVKRNMYVQKLNTCLEYTDLIIDFGNFNVPDKLIIYDDKDSILCETSWIGHISHAPGFVPDFNIGYVYYEQGQLMRHFNSPPIDFKLSNQHDVAFRMGTGRIKIRTKSSLIRIEWHSNPIFQTHSDVYIHEATSWFDDNLIQVNSVVDTCAESSIDTIYEDCRMIVVQSRDVRSTGISDTLCGFAGDSQMYNGVRYYFGSYQEYFFDRVNEFGCDYQDTLIVIPEKLYIPNVCTDEYYLNPMIKFDIYDRWGNHIYFGNKWIPGLNGRRDVQKGVYTVVVDFKGRVFVDTVTLL